MIASFVTKTRRLLARRDSDALGVGGGIVGVISFGQRIPLHVAAKQTGPQPIAVEALASIAGGRVRPNRADRPGNVLNGIASRGRAEDSRLVPRKNGAVRSAADH